MERDLMSSEEILAASSSTGFFKASNEEKESENKEKEVKHADEAARLKNILTIITNKLISKAITDKEIETLNRLLCNVADSYYDRLQDTRNLADAKRVLHYYYLATAILAYRKYPRTVTGIFRTVKSPKKWEVEFPYDYKTIDEIQEFSGTCRYAELGTLYHGHGFVGLERPNGERVDLQDIYP